jgi:hypothetical protein
VSLRVQRLDRESLAAGPFPEISLHPLAGRPTLYGVIPGLLPARRQSE